MKKSPLSLSFKPITSLFRKYHLTIFIVFVAAGLGYAVFSFTSLLETSSNDTTYSSPTNTDSLDKATLTRIKELHTSDAPGQGHTPPAGRINPFSE